MQRIDVIDSHTGGEPTRVIISGGPNLGNGSVAEQRERFRQHFDAYRRGVVCEPRGSDVLVGALLCRPVDPACIAGVIFFNNVGYLGMCGHGTIGVGVTLGHLGRIAAGTHWLETPVGKISFDYDGKQDVSFENVASYRVAKEIRLSIPGVGEIVGDVAWGGNWFFLVHSHAESLTISNVRRLTEVAQRIQAVLHEQGITGAQGAEIDHIELFEPPHNKHNHSRNFVLCPGGAYDRSPCGTGTSAKIACLASDRKLEPGQVWRQESISGSLFEASYRIENGEIVPRISGQAYLTSKSTLLFAANDPLAWGNRE